jgi:hypothetical protein
MNGGGDNAQGFPSLFFFPFELLLTQVNQLSAAEMSTWSSLSPFLKQEWLGDCGGWVR